MSFFVNGQPVAVTDDRGNTVWILSRMGIGVEAAISSEFAKMGGRSIGAYQYCLLLHNILKWEGPDLDGVPCSRANIRRLDRTDPAVNHLIEAVLERIDALNRPQEAEVPDDEKALDPTPDAAVI